MFNKITILLLATLLMSVMPAAAVQIEETNTVTCNSIQNIEDYKINMKDNLEVCSFKNNTTSAGNGTGGLAPLKLNETNEKYSSIEVLIITILIMVMAISFTIGVAFHDYRGNIQKHYNERLRIGQRLNSYSELLDQTRAIDEWCPNLESPIIQEAQQRIVSRRYQAYYLYNRASQRYVIETMEDIIQEYQVLSTPNYLNIPGSYWGNEYICSGRFLYGGIVVGSLSALGLVFIFLRKHPHLTNWSGFA